MRTLTVFLVLVVAARVCDGQWIEGNKTADSPNRSRSFGWLHEENPTVFFKVTSHDPTFRAFPSRSFYKSQRDWRRIIDSTWGPGLPYASKLQIFDTYANGVQNEYDGFLSLGLTPASWDSLRAAYRAKITPSTSRGGFAAIMGYFAGTLRDGHSWAEDTGVLNTPLNPGVPILVISGYVQVEHFGAVLTALLDSSLLVVRTVANHPLNLQPGDVILGYEGRPWKTLVMELIAAELPVKGGWVGSASACGDGLLLGAGMNWHLFDTIDVRKASTGQILHLPVNPLITLPSTPMLNNEQLPIAGIPFPNYFSGQSVSYGIVPNTNVGYIYLYWENETTTDNEFHQAYMALQGTDALIVDMRLNFGGWSFFPQSFAMMFNEPITTIEDAYRCAPSTFTLCPFGNSSVYAIPGQPPEQWEKPIAVLLGPTCISDGDITAQRFRYHDMVKFFGKSSAATLGDSRGVTGFSGWRLRYSISDMFHTVNPGVYLNRREFPIDYPAWFTSAGVAAGHDGVVDEALNWIQHVVYPHDVTTDRHWYRPNGDTVRITVHIESPDTHEIALRAYIELPSGTVLDTLNLSMLGQPDHWGGVWVVPNLEATFKLRVTAKDDYRRGSMTLRNAQRFFSSGPVKVVGRSFWPGDTIPNPGDQLPMRLFIRNLGLVDTLKDLSFNVAPLDTFITSQIINPTGITAVAPGVVDSTWYSFLLTIHSSTAGNTDHVMRVDAYSNGWPAWTDTMVIHVSALVGVNEEKPGIPLSTKLQQNYPNPFNPSTNIKYQIPSTNHVTLKVFDILGREVATLVNEVKQPGAYTVHWDASQHSSGVYFYRLHAGGFSALQKMLLMK